MLLLISVVIDGDKIFAANLIILGPRPSIPVAFEESSLLTNDSTCPQVINGIRKDVFSGIFSLTN